MTQLISMQDPIGSFLLKNDNDTRGKATTPAVELKERARASPDARFDAMARSSSAGSDSTFVGTTAAFN